MARGATGGTFTFPVAPMGGVLQMYAAKRAINASNSAYTGRGQSTEDVHASYGSCKDPIILRQTHYSRRSEHAICTWLLVRRSR